MRLRGLALLLLLASCSAPPEAPTEPIRRSALALSPGDLLINEIYYNALGSSESGKEWVELFNPTDAPVDLSFVPLSAIHLLGSPEAIERHLRLAAEHGITTEHAILAEAHDRWRRERSAIPEVRQIPLT